MRAFHTFRAGARHATGAPEKSIALSDKLFQLQAGRPEKEFWNRFGDATEIQDFRPPQFLFQRATVRDAVQQLVARHLRLLIKPSETWTRSLVRYGVRCGVIEVVGKRDFSDDDRFIEDIGID
ncbi:MAG: hypothetical protein H7A55_01505 [Verrucomicrobiaceae bacterium]|nr:hypothetical protein [Verrucomicrobiaceae bacterium]